MYLGRGLRAVAHIIKAPKQKNTANITTKFGKYNIG
jgi:hypothetical protein